MNKIKGPCKTKGQHKITFNNERVFNMKADQYLSKRNLNRLVIATASVVFAIGSMVYYRSAEEELPEVFRDSFLPWLLPIATLAGMNEALEVYDHINPTTTAQIPELAPKNQVEFSMDAVKMSVGAVLAPPLLACAGAHLVQGAALADTFRCEDDVIQNLFAICLSLPALAKFIFMTVPHVAHTLNGTREQFSLSVTNNEIPKLIQYSMPTLKWWASFLAMVWIHLPEGELIASPIDNPSFKSLAMYGFALAESLPHINQLEQIGANINLTKLRQLTSVQFSLTLMIGLLAGLVHSSQTILAVMATSNENTELHHIVAPIAFEFLIGMTEGIQHSVPAANRASDFIKHSIFGVNNRPLAITPAIIEPAPTPT